MKLSSLTTYNEAALFAVRHAPPQLGAEDLRLTRTAPASTLHPESETSGTSSDAADAIIKDELIRRASRMRTLTSARTRRPA